MAIARSTVAADNEQVRVTVWSFSAGEATGHHRHEFNYVVVPVTGGTLKVTDADGQQHELVQLAGSPYLGTAGTAHNVTGVYPEDTVFVDIELK